MPETPRLALPLIASGQSQKDVTHNEAVLALDRLVALVVASRSEATPPPVAAEGQVYIGPSAGVAGWGQPAGTLMHRQGAGWLGEVPRDGQIALLMDEGVMIVHRAGWQDAWPVSALAIGGRTLLSQPPVAVPPPTGGGTVDAEARAAIAALIQAMQQQGLIA